jgi:hypothetical protein
VYSWLSDTNGSDECEAARGVYKYSCDLGGGVVSESSVCLRRYLLKDDYRGVIFIRALNSCLP